MELSWLPASPLQRYYFLVSCLRRQPARLDVSAYLAVETQRQGSDKSILRQTRALLALFSIAALWIHDLRPAIAAWHPKAFLIFSDADAPARDGIPGHQMSFMSRPH
jgi:hypothetical protein